MPASASKQALHNTHAAAARLQLQLQLLQLQLQLPLQLKIQLQMQLELQLQLRDAASAQEEARSAIARLLHNFAQSAHNLPQLRLRCGL